MVSNDVIAFLKATRLWTEEEAEKTFKRWYQWLTEVTKSNEVSRHFAAVQETNYDQLISIVDIDVDLVCPHHLLPVDMVVHISYLPNGKILGLSKFARVAKDLAQPMTQEEYTKKLVTVIQDKLKPKWCMAIVTGEHACMQCRGVHAKNSKTITSAIRADTKTGKQSPIYENLKREFMRICLKHGW